MSKSQIRDYGFLPAPPWMTLFGRSTLQTWDKRWKSRDPSVCDDYMHIYIKRNGHPCFSADMCEQLHSHFGDQGQSDFQAYSSYPDYEDRLRVLRAYMDSKKPKGFRGLWRDKRDTYSYYTFWGVIIFGGVSVLLGLLSLFASILQTIAAWKALDPPPQGSHS